MRRVLVTGATGFVGRELCGVLARAGCSVRAALRSDGELPWGVAEKAVVGNIGSATNWDAALAGVDCVVHAAARAHVLHDRDSADIYEEINARGTRRLAEAAASAGIRRLVFLSSIKVNGERTASRPYTSLDTPNPEDDYARSKLRAELALCEIAGRSELEPVIVRPPLVYGPGVRANFLRLVRSIRSGWPLPLGCVDNRRSLVSIWNLCDLVSRALMYPGPAAGVWLVSDGQDLSTPELIRRIARSLGRRARLLPVPVAVLESLGALVGKRDEVKRLCGSLELDIASTRSHFGWNPPMSVDESIERTVQSLLLDVGQRAPRGS
jgi:nucleoside-diphosphate-sugar epimerase